jgi:metal-responsive CopG/Arc/MetJ family transcriptional regulator
MSRASATFSVSLPPEMVDEVERARKREHRTRSEFVREALRQYMRNSAELRSVRQHMVELAEEAATIEEVKAIGEAKRDFRTGNFVTIDQLRHALDDRSRRPRRKKPKAHSAR